MLISAGTAVLLAAALVGTTSATTPATAEAVATQYTVSTTTGLYNGASQRTQSFNSVGCHNNADALLGGNAVVNTRGGTTTLDLDRAGAMFLAQSFPQMRWGVYVRGTGRQGLNSVTITVNCLVRTRLAPLAPIAFHPPVRQPVIFGR